MDFCDFKGKFEFLRGKKAYVGFSGGADSLALLVILQHFAEKCSYTPVAVHFEHGIRGEESLRDMEFCRNFCRENKIDLQIHHLDVPKNKLPGESIESCARRLRHEEYEKLNGKLKHVFLGHHENDALENLFIRIFRGGNVSSLVNLSEISMRGSVQYYRPLLKFSKEEIIEFLHQNGITEYCYDSTNSDNIYLRNFVRNEILAKLKEKFPESYAGIRQSYAALSDDAASLSECANSQYRMIAKKEFVANQFYCDLLKNQGVLFRVLRLYISDIINEEFIPNRNWMEKFVAIIRNDATAPKKLEINQNFCYQKQHGVWFVMPKNLQKSADLKWNYAEQNQIEFNNQKVTVEFIEKLPGKEELKNISNFECFLDAEEIGSELTLTARQEGDSIQCFGRSNPSNVKSLIVNKKLTDKHKSALIFFRTSDNRIVFISGLSHSNLGKIHEKSRKILKISVEKI